MACISAQVESARFKKNTIKHEDVIKISNRATKIIFLLIYLVSNSCNNSECGQKGHAQHCKSDADCFLKKSRLAADLLHKNDVGTEK